MLSKEETINFIFLINNKVFSDLSSIIVILQCKIFVDALARIADSADPLIDLLKVIVKYFFPVTRQCSWRMYCLLKLETKMHLISEQELNLAFGCFVMSVLELVSIFLPGLLCGLVYQHITTQCWSEVA